MTILALECTHEALSTAVLHNGEVTEAKSSEWKKAAESLVPLVEHVMCESSLQRKQLQAVAISSGPGSFTALRIGMAVAKGIAFGLAIPLLPVPTMPSMAAAFGATDGFVMAVIQARRNEYYYALYDAQEKAQALASGIWHNRVERGSLEDIKHYLSQYASQPIVMVGRQLQRLHEALMLSNVHYAEADFFSARSLFPFAEKMFANASSIPPIADVVPDYQQEFKASEALPYSRIRHTVS